MVIEGREYYAFSTVWSELPGDQKRAKTDPLDEKYWQALPINGA